MQEISIDQAREKAISWNAQGDKWHFHVLFPECVFNSVNNLYAMVLENRSADLTFVVYSEKGFAKVSQELLKLNYGDDVLDKKQGTAGERPLQPILERCQAYTRDNILWHHHMLLPDCIFNQHPGKWNIVLEGKGEPQVVNSLYDEEPFEDLQQLEIAYFKEIDPAS